MVRSQFNMNFILNYRALAFNLQLLYIFCSVWQTFLQHCFDINKFCFLVTVHVTQQWPTSITHGPCAIDQLDNVDCTQLDSSDQTLVHLLQQYSTQPDQFAHGIHWSHEQVLYTSESYDQVKSFLPNQSWMFEQTWGWRFSSLCESFS